MNCLTHLLNKKLFNNFGSNYLKASNSNYYQKLVLNQRKYSTNCYIKVNNGSKLSQFNRNCVLNNQSFCHSINIYRNLSDDKSGKVSKQTNNETNDELNDTISKSLKIKYKQFRDEDSQVILDVNEELMANEEKEEVYEEMIEELDQTLYLYQEKKKNKKIVDKEWKRGKSGVFDIEELVELLRSENMRDIAVIRVPQELKYCDYMVLANALSLRQLNAFIEFINKVYKLKKHRKDPFPDFGGINSKDWKVIDMRNIVVHIFMKETREYYDIETLWTVGEEYDDKTQRPEVDPGVDVMERHIKFLQEIKPAI